LTLKWGGGGHSGTQEGGDHGLATDRTATGDEEGKGGEKREVENKKEDNVRFTENKRNKSIMGTSHPHDIRSQNLTNFIVTVILEI
jgi:hypothetical protein